MNQEEEKGCSRGEWVETALAALAPAGIGLLGPIILLGGRLSWLGPLLALPVGLCLIPCWRVLGGEGLCKGLERAFGRLGGKGMETLYLLWGLALLTDSARRYSQRLLTIFEGEGARWFFLLSALAVCLLLGGKSDGAVGRTGKIFFLIVGGALGITGALSLGGIQWQNLWPMEGADWHGLPGSALLCLSLAGYGVYALCLPAPAGRGRAWVGPALGCGGLALLLLLTVGTFGPTLAGQMEEPFLSLLEGTGAPGVFRRGDAALLTVLALGDLLLVSLLGRSCGTLWGRLVPPFPALGALPVAGTFLLAGVLPGLGRAWALLWSRVPVGNLLLGILVPVIAVLTIKARERRKRKLYFVGKNPKEK